MTLLTDCPTAAMSDSARMIGGSAITQSTMRWLDRVRDAAVVAGERCPTATPIVIPTSTDARPT